MALKDKEIVRVKTEVQQSYRRSQDLKGDIAQFRTALRNAEENNHQLKRSLADETRVKIELFTALSDTRRYQEQNETRRTHRVSFGKYHKGG